MAFMDNNTFNPKWIENWAFAPSQNTRRSLFVIDTIDIRISYLCDLKSISWEQNHPFKKCVFVVAEKYVNGKKSTREFCYDEQTTFKSKMCVLLNCEEERRGCANMLLLLICFNSFENVVLDLTREKWIFERNKRFYGRSFL